MARRALPARAVTGRLGGLLAAALIGLPAGAGAQVEAPEEVEALEIVRERLDGIDVQDEARAITAFSAGDLDRASIYSVDSLAYRVPGLHVGQSSQHAIITLRGISTENTTLTGEPGVAFHVDGVNYGQPAAARLAFFDLETLDVKRGPQGLMGGKNSTSGTINLVTRKPHDAYELDADVLLGNHDRVRARGAINVPLGERAATRLAFFHEDRDGYLDNVLQSSSRDPFDADDFGLRAHLRLRPTDALDVVLTYSYFKQTGNGPQADIVPRSPYDPGCGDQRREVGAPELTVMTRAAACFRPSPVSGIEIIDGIPTPFLITFPARPATEDADRRAIVANFASAQDNRFWGTTGTLDWDAPALPLLGETRIKLIGGFQHSELGYRWDFDATDIARSALSTSRDVDQHSAELQWSGNLAERLDWQLGGFFLRETGEDVPGGGIEQTAENESYGGSLHTIYHVSETIRLELGGRLIQDRKQTWLLRRSGGFSGCTGDLGSQPVPGTRSERRPGRANPGCTQTFRGRSWGSVIDWRPFDGNHLLYAGIDRGYKSGGFRAGGRGEYLPEQVWAYALGSKSSFLDARVELNIEGFFYAYQDMQLTVFDLDGFTLRTENADARMYGFDVEARASPIAGLQLSAIVSHLKTETRDYFSLDPADVGSPDGFPEGTDLTRIENFQNSRLDARRRAETDAESSAEALALLALSSCRARPPAPVGSVGVACGTLGDRNGLDDFSGNDLPRSPEWKVTLAAEYEIPLGRYGFLTPRVQYTWQDDTYYRVFNKDLDLQTAHHLTDVKLMWRSPEERWQAEVFVTNIENEAPKQNILVGSRFNGSPALAWYGQPRFYGVQLGFRY